MQRRSVRRSDPRYQKLRTRNNASVKKSREKSRREQDETIESIRQLEIDNQQLIENIQILKDEYQQLHTIFKQHTGIDIDEMTPPQSPSKDEKSSASVLTINTTTENNSSSNNELDASNLDGSIVIINGVQYKIFSMTKT